MITKKDLKEILNNERVVYQITTKRKLWAMITLHYDYRIWRWLRSSRKYDYYSQFYRKGLIGKIRALYYLRKRNRLASELGFDIGTENIGKGLLIYHPGTTVINGSAVIGENCILHGNNCIGNKGPAGSPCPIIGNNVEIGVGASVIGGVKIADNIKIGAGSVVVDSFDVEGLVIGGVPAKILKKK